MNTRMDADSAAEELDRKRRRVKLGMLFPAPGAKLLYRGTHVFWFTDIVANAEQKLRKGEIYTLKTIRIASSWARITLEETGDTEFALGFFDYVSGAN